jgi:uncharacterized protein (DUF1800 family)
VSLAIGEDPGATTTSTSAPAPSSSTTSSSSSTTSTTTSTTGPSAAGGATALASDPVLRAKLAHLYRRAGFGSSPAELDAAETRGYAASVELLLSGPDPVADAITPPTLTPPPGSPGSNESTALIVWWLQRMVASQNPLREKLPWFWHGHLTSSLDDVELPALLYAQNQLFRSSGWGSFETLIRQVTTDPAMLLYLNLLYSNKYAPNENYARELCELFVLGRVDASGNQPYAEADIPQIARALTGWTTNPARTAIVFDASRWDAGAKTFLGQTGAFTTDDVVRIVTHRPAASRWLPSRLWSHFAYPVNAADPVVDDLAPGFAADLDITKLLRAIFLHPSFQSTQARTGRVRSPVEWLVTAQRSLGLTPTDSSVWWLTTLQQVPFRPLNVAGWPTNGYWCNSAGALDRVRIAMALASSANLAAITALTATARPAAVATLLGIEAWTPRTLTALNTVRNEPASLVALALVSPEYLIG